MKEKRTLSDRKRDDIINAAIKEFEQNGFQKTSMDQVAKTANVSKRTVYNHFPSKDSLFTEITSIMWEKGLSATAYAYRDDVPLDIQLTAIAEQEMDLLKSDEFVSVSRLIFAECFHSKEAIDKAMAQMGEAESGLDIWLKQAIEDNRLRIPDHEVASAQFYGMLKSLAFWPQVIGYGAFPDKSTYRELVDSSVSMFLKQYGK